MTRNIFHLSFLSFQFVISQARGTGAFRFSFVIVRKNDKEHFPFVISHFSFVISQARGTGAFRFSFVTVRKNEK